MHCLHPPPLRPWPQPALRCLQPGGRDVVGVQEPAVPVPQAPRRQPAAHAVAHVAPHARAHPVQVDHGGHAGGHKERGEAAEHGKAGPRLRPAERHAGVALAQQHRQDQQIRQQLRHHLDAEGEGEFALVQRVCPVDVFLEVVVEGRLEEIPPEQHRQQMDGADRRVLRHAVQHHEAHGGLAGDGAGAVRAVVGGGGVGGGPGGLRGAGARGRARGTVGGGWGRGLREGP